MSMRQDKRGLASIVSSFLFIHSFIHFLGDSSVHLRSPTGHHHPQLQVRGNGGKKERKGRMKRKEGKGRKGEERRFREGEESDGRVQ